MKNNILWKMWQICEPEMIMINTIHIGANHGLTQSYSKMPRHNNATQQFGKAGVTFPSSLAAI